MKASVPTVPFPPSMTIRFGALVLAILSVCGSHVAAADAPGSEPPARIADLTRWVISCDISRDGRTLVTAGGDSLLYRPGDVCAWNLADGVRSGEFAGHPTSVWAVRLSADGTLLATSGYDGLVRIWDVATRQPKHDLKKHKGWARTVAFSPDGKRLASGGEDGSVILWDATSGAELKSIAAHEGGVLCLAFSPDGATLASGGSDKAVKLWNPADGSERAKLQGHGDTVWAVAYAPDGALLASGGADRTLRLWSAAEAQPVAALGGHKDWITSLAFSADGKRLVSGGMDGGVKLWDMTAKGEQEGPENAGSSVWAVAFTPDARTLVVGTHKGPKMMPAPAPKLLPPPPPPPPAAATPATVNLVPQEFKSMAGATGSIAADGTVTVTGPLARDTYTIKAVLPAGGKVTAFRLDAIADDSLPQKGPGRAGNGNFVLSTFAVLAASAQQAESLVPVRFAGALADFEQAHYSAAAAIDGDAATGWAVAGGIGAPHHVTFTVHPESGPLAGAPVTITLDQQYADGQHALGKFRLSVIHEPAAAP